MGIDKSCDDSPLTRRHFIKGVFQRALILGASTSLVNCALPPETETRVSAAKDFTPRIIARSGIAPVQGLNYHWHSAPDGGGSFETSDGGWIYVSNSERNKRGSVGALRFDGNAEIIDAYTILENTRRNCSGTETPWNTWLSCEETSTGIVWECDPFNINASIARPELGVFRHESACVDPITSQIYLTEDQNDGCLYRFTPTFGLSTDVSNLSDGLLEVAIKSNDSIDWIAIPDPSASGEKLRYQVPGSRKFKGGEGITHHQHYLFFTTKIDKIIWRYNTINRSLKKIQNIGGNRIDDIINTPGGDILVAQDGPAPRILLLTNNFKDTTTFALLPDHDDSEITGFAFDPSGQRLYFSSQRGNTGLDEHGITFELSGNFNIPINADIKLKDWVLEH